MKLSAALGVLMVVTMSVAVPVDAACTSDLTITSFTGQEPEDRSFIWTLSLFEPFYFTSYDPFDYAVPFTGAATASFWTEGQGDVAVGMGNDNGSLDLVATSVLGYDTEATFGIFYGAELDGLLSDPAVDGCGGANACSCLLLNDVDPAGRSGYFALVSATSDTAGNVAFNLGGGLDPLGNGDPIVLREIPVPTVTGAAWPQSGTVEITVSVPSRSAGVYESATGAGCACGPTGFLVYEQVVTRSADWTPPADRDPAAWTLAAVAGGGGQGVTPADGSVTLSVDCPSPSTQQVYLATQLVFDSGFSTTSLSSNSFPVDCVEPADPMNPLPAAPFLSRFGSPRRTGRENIR